MNITFVPKGLSLWHKSYKYAIHYPYKLCSSNLIVRNISMADEFFLKKDPETNIEEFKTHIAKIQEIYKNYYNSFGTL